MKRSAMFTLRIWINRIRQIDQGYRDRDDALRKAGELWDSRASIFAWMHIPPSTPASQGSIEFQIVSDAGMSWEHRQILAEIKSRPEFRDGTLRD